MIAFSATQSQTSKLEGAPSTWQRLLPRSGVGARAGIEFIDENGDGRLALALTGHQPFLLRRYYSS
jgi:hypothetical protein